MLAAIDFAVIPEKAIDPGNLKIIDYRNTSGPYYLFHESDGKKQLNANTRHWNINNKTPVSIEMYSTPTSASNELDPIDLLLKNTIDHVSTITELTCEQLAEAEKALGSEVSFHKTAPIKLFYILFTNTGRTLPKQERIGISKAISSTLKEYFEHNPDCRQLTNEYYPPQSDGYLDAIQKTAAVNIRNQTPPLPPNKKYSIGAPPSRMSLFTKMFATNPQFKIIEERRIPWNLWIENNDEPVLVVGAVDSSFREDIGNLSYANSQGFFFRTREAGNQWLSEYMATDDKKKRLAELRRLHFNAVVEDPLLIPWASRPYVAITRNNWKTFLPNFASNNPLWNILIAKD